MPDTLFLDPALVVVVQARGSYFPIGVDDAALLEELRRLIALELPLALGCIGAGRLAESTTQDHATDGRERKVQDAGQFRSELLGEQRIAARSIEPAVEGQHDGASEHGFREVARMWHVVGGKPAGRERMEVERRLVLVLSGGELARYNRLKRSVRDLRPLGYLSDYVGELAGQV